MSLNSSNRQRIIILGAPGSGKGTQCIRISEMFKLVHISTGDLFRAECEKKTPWGLEAIKIMNSGQLLPDEMAFPLILQRLNQQDCTEFGFLLDGFPRSISHMSFLKEHNVGPTCVIKIQVSDQVAIERQAGRLVDPITGKIYHAALMPADEEVAQRLVKRATDNHEKAKIRLKVYHDEMDGAAQWFPSNIFHTVNGECSEDLVFEQIKQILAEKL